MRGWDDVLYVCDQCGALWPVDDFRWDGYPGMPFLDFDTILAERGLVYDDVIYLDPPSSPVGGT
jgi:hypothetical protein